MRRIPPSSKLRQEVEEVFTGWETKEPPLDNFVSLGARYMLQVAVEQEVEDYLAELITTVGPAEEMAGAMVMSQEK